MRRVEKNQKKRVVIAMSGGVDSSVAAALLKEQGFDVIGIFMKLWAEPEFILTSKVGMNKSERENICCSVEASTTARAVANKLGIPFYIVNFEKEFKQAVVDYYVNEYEEGRTPNPCVICNRDIKGELLMRKATELDAQFLATGHYALIISDSVITNRQLPITKKVSKSNNQTEKYHFYQGVDKNKDQTYFLWTLTQEKLAHLLFPVGGLTKQEVRNLAKKYELPTAERRESQGICFVPDRNIGGFLRRYAQNLTEPGEIRNLEGKVIGQHDGLINYTIGQREGLGLGGPKAYYVVRLNTKNNILVVGDEKDLYKKNLIATHLNWINRPDFKSKNLGARIRHGHPIEKCTIKKLTNEEIEVIFQKAQRAVTPGQSIVFYGQVLAKPQMASENDELYAGQEVLGGGIIK